MKKKEKKKNSTSTTSSLSIDKKFLTWATVPVRITSIFQIPPTSAYAVPIAHTCVYWCILFICTSSF